MTTKILVNAPPGAGMRTITQFLEIMVGSFDDIALNEIGGNHNHTTGNMFVTRGPNTVGFRYIPFKPVEYLEQVNPPKTGIEYNRDYMFLGFHCFTHELHDNIDALSDWKILNIWLKTPMQADLAASLCMLKNQMIHENLSLKKAMKLACLNSRYVFENHPTALEYFDDLPDNIVDVDYFEFFENPEPYLRSLIPEATDDRVELAVKAVHKYWKIQHEE